MRKKKNSQKLMFFEIWEEREHICENCQRHLGMEPLAQYFSHIKPKGLYPELKFAKSNIQLLCFDCHYAHDFKGKEAFDKLKR